MKTITKSFLAGMAVAASAFVFAGEAAAQESSFGPADAKYTYYWISNKANLPLFVQYDYVGMKRIADELGVKVVVAGPTDFDVPGFIAAVDQVCAQKPSGVSVVGGWDPSLTEPVKRCIEQGVPTVVDDGDLPDSGRLAYIGTNWTQVGVSQAKKLMELLPKGGKIGMMSIINAGNMREAVAGFQAYVKANGGDKFQIVANEDDNGDAQKAAQVTAALLAAHPDIAGIAGFDSESGAGIVTALREAGKNPGDIKVTAMEQTPDFFKTAKDGWVDGIVVQNRELFIYYAVKLLHDFNTNTLKSAGLAAAQGGRPIPDTVDTGVLLVTKDNVEKVLSALNVK
ncbi:substrate-binding domain-containing protein [Rhizobium sp. RAF56]|uniref:substrate-binding domain-containing protein n=1 Tax=Rhizobium sp. RAF56 TaxID=3233062 RepID=UPI003F959346